jgi:hypothetical protein
MGEPIGTYIDKVYIIATAHLSPPLLRVKQYRSMLAIGTEQGYRIGQMGRIDIAQCHNLYAINH